MGKGNFQGRKYESVYNFHFDDLARAYFGDDEIDRDGDNTQLYQVAYENAMDELKTGIEKNTTLNNHFTTTVKKENRHLTKKYYDFLVIAESDFYKLVVNDESDLIVALVIDDNAYNYDLSENDIENKLKESYDDIDNALRKMLLSFGIDLYKPNGPWLSGKVSNNG
jgi:hypothetical protein